MQSRALHWFSCFLNPSVCFVLLARAQLAAKKRQSQESSLVPRDNRLSVKGMKLRRRMGEVGHGNCEGVSYTSSPTEGV